MGARSKELVLYVPFGRESQRYNYCKMSFQMTVAQETKGEM